MPVASVPPHYVGTRGDDGAVVGTGDDRRGQTRGAEQVGGTHHDQRAALRGAQALRPQAGPNLPMPFTMKRTLGDDRPDVGGQHRIGPRRLRPALRRGRGVIPSISPGLHRGARHLPYAGDAGDPVRLLGGGRSLVTHRFDLHQPKGRPASRCRIFSTRSALSVARSATTLFKRRVSSSSMGVSRCFKRASPPARNSPRHCESFAAVTPWRRLRPSSDSPLSYSMTTDTFRRADHRPVPTSADKAEASPVALRAPSEAPASCCFPWDIAHSPARRRLSKEIVGRGRMKALAHFRDGKFDILIATDIAARGLDVEGISHVVNFELPDIPEDYIHRIGRTARAGGSGNAISLVAPQEHEKLAAIERLIKKQIKQEPVSGFLITTDASKLEQSRKRTQQPTTPSRRKLNRSKDSSFSRNGAKQTLQTGRKKSHRNKRTRSRQERLFRDPLGRQSGLPD